MRSLGLSSALVLSGAVLQTEMLCAQVSVSSNENKVCTAAAWTKQLTFAASSAKRGQLVRNIDLLSVNDCEILSMPMYFPSHRQTDLCTISLFLSVIL